MLVADRDFDRGSELALDAGDIGGVVDLDGAELAGDYDAEDWKCEVSLREHLLLREFN